MLLKNATILLIMCLMLFVPIKSLHAERLSESQTQCFSMLRPSLTGVEEMVKLCSVPIVYVVGHHKETLRKKGELFYIDLQSPKTGKSRRVWQEIFDEASHDRPDINSFIFRQGDTENIMCFGYVQGLEVFVYAIDVTSDLRRFETIPPQRLSNTNAHYHTSVGHPNSIGLYNFFSSNEFLKRTDKIEIEDISYSKGGWDVTLWLSGMQVRFHGESAEETVRWSRTDLPLRVTSSQERETVEVLQTYLLPLQKKAILSSRSVTFILESPDSRSKTSQLYGKLFYIEIQSSSGERQRIWQEIFQERFPIWLPEPDSFVFSFINEEQLLSFGYLQGYDAFVYVFDITRSLTPLEEVSPIVLKKGDSQYHNFLGHMNGSVGIPRLFRENGLGVLAKKGGRIEALTYKDQMLNLTLRLSELYIHFQGRLEENIIKWLVVSQEE